MRSAELQADTIHQTSFLSQAFTHKISDVHHLYWGNVYSNKGVQFNNSYDVNAKKSCVCH